MVWNLKEDTCDRFYPIRCSLSIQHFFPANHMQSPVKDHFFFKDQTLKNIIC